MESVIAERTLADVVTAEGLHALAAQLAECLAQNRVRPLLTLLGYDGRRMACVFTAPDAEAVRRVDRVARLPTNAIWTASVHEPSAAAAPARDLIVVERSFAAPVEFAAIQALEDGGAWCLDVHRIRFVRTYFARDRRRMLCLYEAPDAEAVRTAQKTIGMPFDDAWAARLLEH